MPKGKSPLSLLIALVQTCGGGAVYYVDVNSAHPVSPYTNWANAALTIQDAVDVASSSDEIDVAQGTYRVGARFFAGVSNRVIVSSAIKIQSVAGPDATIIEGVQSNFASNAVRCVYLVNGATLIGFTLSNGSAPGSGVPGTLCGGVLGQSTAAWLSNCVIVGNSNRGAGLVTLLNCSLIGNAITGGTAGGGASGCVLTNCLLSDNLSSYAGGAADQCLLSGCIVSNNSAYTDGGGVFSSTLYDCTLTGNSLQRIGGHGGGAENSTLNHCLLTNNSAPYAYGGGCSGDFLTNCTLINNSARFGGGASGATLNNCILSGNSAAENGGGAENSTLISCAVTNNGALFGGGAYLC